MSPLPLIYYPYPVPHPAYGLLKPRPLSPRIRTHSSYFLPLQEMLSIPFLLSPHTLNLSFSLSCQISHVNSGHRYVAIYHITAFTTVDREVCPLLLFAPFLFPLLLFFSFSFPTNFLGLSGRLGTEYMWGFVVLDWFWDCRV